MQKGIKQQPMQQPRIAQPPQLNHVTAPDL